MLTINRSRIKTLIEREEKRYIAERPKSRALFKRAKGSLFRGVPMSWMTEWPGAFPVFVSEAKGARLTDVDGHTYVDLCLGDSGALTGHSPKPATDAIAKQVCKGMTCMLPSEDSVWVGEELARRFGLPYWQIYTTATDADRFAIKMARRATGRNLVLVFDGCYHGSVDEALVSVRGGPYKTQRRNVVGPLPNPASRVIQFNDLDALEKALSPQDVACVLCEPAMTNAGIIFPEAGYHEALRKITRRFGTLLIIDETHTISAGPGGLTRIWNLEPDFFTIGKAIASGLPVAALGLAKEVADKLDKGERCFGLGIGGTLAGTVLQAAAIKATLEHVLTQKAYDRMIPIAKRLAEGVTKIVKDNHMPWHVNRLGCRAEYRFCPFPPKNGLESEEAFDDDLDALIHVYMANRGILLTPFHSMVLISPATTVKDVDLHNKVFNELVKELVE
jgi:glutamate-1-semialdehyde 2,1-aminomutase